MADVFPLLVGFVLEAAAPFAVVVVAPVFPVPPLRPNLMFLTTLVVFGLAVVPFLFEPLEIFFIEVTL